MQDFTGAEPRKANKMDNTRELILQLRNDYEYYVTKSTDGTYSFETWDAWNSKAGELLLQIPNFAALLRLVRLVRPETGIDDFNILRQCTSVCELGLVIHADTALSLLEEWSELEHLKVWSSSDCENRPVVRIQDFCKCHRIETIQLSGVDVDELGFKWISNQTGLKSISFTKSAYGGLQWIPTENMIENITVGELAIGPEISALTRCENLKNLSVSSCTVSAVPEDFEFLRDSGIRELEMSFSNVNDSHLPALSAAPHLSVLTLEKSNVTASGLRQLPAFPALEKLYIDISMLTEKSVGYMSECPLLQDIKVFAWDRPVEKRLIQLLRRKCKQCEIMVYSS